jgi:branched-chain amino acid transport system substrate-binding protein
MVTGIRRRSISLVGATTVLALVLGACGGSAIEEPTGAGVIAAEEQVPQPGIDAPADQAVAGAVPDAVGAAAETGNTVVTNGAETAVVPGAAAPGKAKDTGAGAKGAAGTAVADSSLTGLIQRQVETQAIFGGSAPCKPATGSVVPIGNVSTLSGVLGELFAPVVPALETFVASQNACGGLNGHRIKFFIEDDQGDPSNASSRMQEMVQKNKVIAFVGNIQPLSIDGALATITKLGVPVVGADMVATSDATHPMIFAQGGNVPSTTYGFVDGISNYFKVKNVGNLYCLEVPRPCELAARVLRELAPQFGLTVSKQIQVSITSPSYVNECLQLKNAGAEVVAMNLDGASQIRIARSCTQTQFFPKVVSYPLSVGNEKQFLQGLKWMGDAYIPLNHFPWMANKTPAEKYWQASRTKYSPGSESGSAASLGWAAGALLVAASAGLSPTTPSAAQLVEALYSFRGQKFTELGGLAGPRSFFPTGNHKLPYCIWALISNDTNTGWKTWADKPSCTEVVAPSDPQNLGKS